MAVFEYTAKDVAGNQFSGVYTDIDNINDLRNELAKISYTLVKGRRQKNVIRKRRGKIKPSEVVAFAYEFSGMYSAGLSIVRCLETLEAQIENRILKSVIIDVREHVETGSTLREAFEKYSSIFSSFFLGMVEAGEAGGKLGETLQMSADYLEKQDNLKKQVKSAFAYPIIVSVMCMVIVSALIIFVIPVFEKLYKQLHVPLPGPTLLLIGISHIVRDYWWIALPAVVLMVLAVCKFRKNALVKVKLDSFKLKMPVFGKLNRMVVASRFIRTFAMMCSAGISVVEALELASQVADNNEMSKASTTIKESVMTGSSIAPPMSKFSIFPPMIVQLAAAGEEGGIMPEMLIKGVDFLDKNIDRAIKSLLTKIEPIMSVTLGLIVGTILLAVYLPMFDYMSHIK